MKKATFLILLLLALLVVYIYAETNCGLETSVTPSGSGTVTPASGTYDKGTKLTLTAQPALGYRFDHWSGDITGTSSSITIIMNSNNNIVAHFVEEFKVGNFGSDLPDLLGDDMINPNPGLAFLDNWTPQSYYNRIGSTRKYGEMTIKNELEYQAFVVLCKSDEPKTPYKSKYVGRYMSHTFDDIEDGEYILYYSLGMDWQPKTKTFDNPIAYRRFEEEFEFVTTPNTYTIWTVTLYSISAKTASGGAKTETVSEDDFPLPK